MATNTFFTSATEQSKVKAEIVSKYFRAWANVMVPMVKKRARSLLCYVDLFSGKGEYDDGTPSTPVLVLQEALKDPALRDLLATRFNDANSGNTEKLRTVLTGLPGFGALKHKPKFTSDEITEAFAAKVETATLSPTLFFLDPWGYKGLSLRLVKACVKDFGCDCIFFFNYKRVNAGLENDLFAEPMEAIFGQDRAMRLRSRLEGMDPKKREDLILEELLEAVKAECGPFALKFPFATNAGTQTSHYLMFVTKGRKGYDIMKRIMAVRSSSRDEGVPSLGFNPAEARQPTLPFRTLSRSLDSLESDLLHRFAGRRLTVQQIFDEHNVGTRFLMENYKEVLRRLEKREAVRADPPATSRRKMSGGSVSLPDDVMIAFPETSREKD